MLRIIGDITCMNSILRTGYKHEDGGQYVVDDGWSWATGTCCPRSRSHR